VDTWRQFCGKIWPADVTPNTQDLVAADVLRTAGVIDKIRAWDVAGGMPKAARNRASCQTGLANRYAPQPYAEYSEFLSRYNATGGKNEEPDRDFGLGLVLLRRRGRFGRRNAQ
jgi:muramidase (phage lysozyme)